SINQRCRHDLAIRSTAREQGEPAARHAFQTELVAPMALGRTAVVPFPARPHSIPELQAAAFTPEARVRKTAGYFRGPFSSVEFKALPGLDLHPVVVFESVFVGHIHIACTGRHAADLVLDCPI